MSVTLSELKDHLRITESDEDTILQIYLDAALDYIEGKTGQILTNRARTDYFDSFGDLELVGDNPTSVVVQYVDTDGATQVLSSSVYDVKTHKARPYITLAYNQSWPSVRAQDAAIDVAYTSGYTTSTLPDAYKGAVLIEAATNYEHREDESIMKLHNRKAVSRLLHSRMIYNT